MSSIVERLFVLAGKKKKSTEKYSSDVENCYEELLQQFSTKTDYSKNDRAFRLMIRLRNSLGSDGYKFLEKALPVGPTKKKVPSQVKHLLYRGGLVTLLKTRPPANLDADTVMRLMEWIGSKQCYSYTFSPVDKGTCRRSGNNISLPKPLTWARLNHNGLDIEPVMTNDGRQVVEIIRVDGMKAFTFDRKTFYIANSGMCKRWVDGLDRMISEYFNR